MSDLRTLSVVTAILLFPYASAQSSCSSSLRPSFSATTASGFHVSLVATGLARPRGIQFDRSGRLLVVEAPKDGKPGISALTLNDDGGACVREATRKKVIDGSGVSMLSQRE